MARTPAKKTAARKAPARKRSARPANSPPPATSEPAATPQPAKRPGRVSVTTLEQSSTRLRVVMLNLAFVGAFLLLVPVIAAQFWQNDVIIEPISVPDNLAAMGLTPDVVASRLWDGLQDAEDAAATSKATVRATPTSKRIRFSIPETGVSIESLVNQTRQFFHAYQTRINGEFVCLSTTCSPKDVQLRLRIVRDTASVIDLPPIGDMEEREYFARAGVQVMSVLDPFIAASATADREPLRAVTLARHLIRTRHPDAKWAHNLIGNIRTTNGEYALAATEYRAALALDPEFAIARYNLGLTLISLRETAEAREVFEALAQRDPHDPTILLGLGEIAALEGNIDDAVARFEAAAAVAPNDPQYLGRAGQVEADAGRIDAAEAHLQQALRIDPSFAPALGSLGKIYLGAGEYAAAEPLFRDLADFLPDDAEAQDLHAQSLMLNEQPELALARFRKAEALDPGNVDRLQGMAGALFFLDRVEEARETIERALALAPDRPDLHTFAGQLDLLSGDLDATLASYQRAIDLDPENPTYAANLADALFYAGRVPEAIARLEALTKSHPQRSETWFTLGSYYSAVSRYAESVTAFEAFLAGAPALPMYDRLRELAETGLADSRAALVGTGEAPP